MISFVWTPGESLLAGAGDAENYTIGHVRELNRRGVDAQVVTVGRGTSDGSSGFVGIPFRALRHVAEVSSLEGTVVVVSDFPAVRTQNPVHRILHVPPPEVEQERLRVAAQLRDRGLIATSELLAESWSQFLDVDLSTIHLVTAEQPVDDLLEALAPGTHLAATIRTEEHR